jgi:alpha-1,2-mannosyltransferase
MQTETSDSRSTKTVLGANEGRLAFVGFAVVVLGLVVWTSRGPLAEKTDFSLIYTGTRIVYAGHGAQLYDLQQQKQVNASLFTHPQPLLYEHPPFEALLLAPLAMLPYRTAYLCWGLLNACVWLALPLVLRPYAPVPSEVLGYFSLWLLFAPLGVTLFQGQTSLMLLAVFVLTFKQLKKGKTFQAGVWLGLGLFKFQFVVPFVLIFLLRRQWKFVKGFSCSASVLALLSLAAVGGKGISTYIHLLLKVGNDPGNVSYGAGVDMPTLHGFLYALLGHWVTSGISILTAILSFLFIFLVAKNSAWTREADDSFDLMFAGAVAVSLMTGFHMFTHDFSPLMLALVLVLAHFPRAEYSRRRLIIAVPLVVFWMPPIYFALVNWHCMYLMFPMLVIFAMSAISLAGSSTQSWQVEGRQLAAR